MQGKRTFNSMIETRPQSRLRYHPSPAGGFTIIELLIVVALIILLLSILIVAVSAATRTSKNASTQARMDSIKKALVRFKGDIGYYPPMLGVAPPGSGPGIPDLRRLYPNSVPNPDAAGTTYIDQMQEYYSTCTLAEYLIGYGNHYEDGFGRVNATTYANETPPLGIRHPSSDGIWGAATIVPPGNAANGALSHRMGGPAHPFNSNLDEGKVFGPYLELEDARLIAGVHYGASGLETYFAGDTLPINPSGPAYTWDTIPKAIVDYWGMPIRYYRRPYPQGALGQSYRSVDRDGDGEADRVPTLSDVYVLRPQSFKQGTEIANPYPDDDGRTSSSSELDTAEFALLSSGGDRRLNNQVTVDEEGYNNDNIVEVGP
jgi:type II secretory pathway pseudopilin PulG